MTMLGRKHSEETKKKMREIAIRDGRKPPAKKGQQHFLGKTHTPEVRERIRQSKIGKKNPMYGKTGSLHPNWKGDDVGYCGVHDWIQKHYGKAMICEQCGSRNKVEWASITGKHKRDIRNYIQLCKKCHNNYDGVNIWQQTR